MDLLDVYYVLDVEKGLGTNIIQTVPFSLNPSTMALFSVTCPISFHH